MRGSVEGKRPWYEGGRGIVIGLSEQTCQEVALETEIVHSPKLWKAMNYALSKARILQKPVRPGRIEKDLDDVDL